jgi:hypothetical protein
MKPFHSHEIKMYPGQPNVNWYHNTAGLVDESVIILKSARKSEFGGLNPSPIAELNSFNHCHQHMNIVCFAISSVALSLTLLIFKLT